MNDPNNVVLIYADANDAHHEQPLPDITAAGTLIDPDNGDDLELIGWRWA